MEFNLTMVKRINTKEIKGITDERKNSSCATGDNAASIEEEASAFKCEGDECHIDWRDN
jgi:hypothetical protein